MGFNSGFKGLNLFGLRGAQVPGASSPWRINITRWCLICVGLCMEFASSHLFWSVHF